MNGVKETMNMINKIKMMLDAGETVELECIDKEGFVQLYKENYILSTANNRILKQEKLIVKSVITELERVYLKGGVTGTLNCILFSELKYFKIKENKPTFDDLVDVTLQAVKDGVLAGFNVDFKDVKQLSFWFSSKENSALIFDNRDDYSEDIEHIKSLYKETFVINNEEDINRVKVRESISFSKEGMSVAKLTNGNEILITRLKEDNANGVVVYMRNGLYKNYLDIEVLKGATIIQ